MRLLLPSALLLGMGSALAQPIIQTGPQPAAPPPAIVMPQPAAPLAPYAAASSPVDPTRPVDLPAPAIVTPPAVVAPLGAGGTPPASRLGQQVSTPVPVAMPAAGAGAVGGPRVVYPPPDAVVERAVREIEDMQLTPDQYERLKGIFLDRARQRSTPYNTPPKPVTRTLMVNLDPGVEPPVLRLTRGQQTSIVFSDVSGQPWFIERVSLNRQLFSDGRSGLGAMNTTGSPAATGTGQGEPPTNVLTLEALQPASYGNVTVTLRGQSTPVIFVLASAQTEADMRVDAKVPGTNPDASHAVTLQATPTLDNALPYFLDGVPPTSAKRLRVTGLDAEAWVFERNLYVKARANAQYPAYMAAARSTSGVSVYRYHGVPKAVTFTTGGRAATAFFE